MIRDMDTLANQEFDLLIIGAGIHGACAAYEAARRGLKTALVDKGDFCSGNSANSLKIVHGGLRYLQNFDFKRMRDSIRERNMYQRLAPHLVSPLPCILPTFGMTTKSKHALRVAMLLNDFISMDRNKGISDSDNQLPNGKTLSREQLAEAIPYVDKAQFTGGALWHDAQLQNTERFVLAFVKGAVQEGTVASNYCSVEKIKTRDGKVVGASVRDEVTKNSFEIRCKSILNCAGPGTNKLLGIGEETPFKPSIAMNLIFDAELPGGYAAGLRHVFEHNGNKWSRIFFYTPWRGKTVIGTRHTPVENEIEINGPTWRQIDRFIHEIQETTPSLKLNRDNLSWWHWGVIPMDGINSKNGEVLLQRHARVLDHKKDGFDGMTSALGVKYTTGRSVAERALRNHCARNGLQCLQGKLEVLPLPGGNVDKANTALEKLQTDHGFSQQQLDHVMTTHGDEASELLSLIKKNPDLGKDLGDGVTAAQIVYAVRHEAAVHLADVVLRRTALGSHRRPTKDSVEACAEIMAGELSWDDSRKQQEIDSLISRYSPIA